MSNAAVNYLANSLLLRARGVTVNHDGSWSASLFGERGRNSADLIEFLAGRHSTTAYRFGQALGAINSESVVRRAKALNFDFATGVWESTGALESGRGEGGESLLRHLFGTTASAMRNALIVLLNDED